MKHPWPWSLGLLATLLLFPSCGGSGAPTAPSATPTPAATASPTPAGTATPQPTPAEPNEDDNPGPVASVTVRLFVVASDAPSSGGVLRDGPYYDPDRGADIVYVNEFIILDTTPKNAAGQKCQTRGQPVWSFENGQLFEHIVGSQPFQYRLFARRRGVARVSTVIDGVRSNPVVDVEIR